MANRLVWNKAGIRQLMNDAKMDEFLFSVAKDVQTEAIATAQDAQRGPGGTISGYAEAGFFVGIEDSGDRPIAIVAAKAPGDVSWAAHFFTTKRDGIGHLRAALYKFTHRGA